MKKVLISGYYGFDNFGDEAILGVLLSKLRSADVTVLSANPEKTSRLYNVKSLHSFDAKNIIPKLPEYDALISGGGSLIQNVTSIKSLMYYCGLITMFGAMNSPKNPKDIIIFAQGVGPIKGFWANRIAKEAFKKATFVSVRDENSQNILKKYGVTSELVCDPIFDLTLPVRNKTRKVGIQLRKFDTLTDELFDNMVKHIALKFSDREIELIAFQDSEDVGISKVFLNKLKEKNPTINAKIVEGLDNKQIINRVGEYDYLFAMRYHACILGLKYGIKTMAISYDPKVETLAKDAKIPYLVMDSKKNDYNKSFEDMEKLTAFKLLEYSASKEFDWSKTGIDFLID